VSKHCAERETPSLSSSDRLALPEAQQDPTEGSQMVDVGTTPQEWLT
jgi:hypothetical protein